MTIQNGKSVNAQPLLSRLLFMTIEPLHSADVAITDRESVLWMAGVLVALTGSVCATLLYLNSRVAFPAPMRPNRLATNIVLLQIGRIFRR